MDTFLPPKYSLNSFFVRHVAVPKRMKLIHGLNNAQICAVNDIGYINQPEQKFLGVSVEGPVYTYGTRTSVSSTKTNFLAGMHSPYRWSDGWDTSDGGAAFSMIAMAEVARQNGRSVLEEIRPVVDFEGNGSHFTLRDLRGESASYEGRVTRDGGGVQKYSNGYYAPSGYAYETAGYKEPTDPCHRRRPRP